MRTTKESFPIWGIDDYKLLEEVVNLNSQTRNVSGVNNIQNILAIKLSSLNFKIELIKNSEMESGDLLVAELSGLSTFSIVVISHADTVLGPGNDSLFRKCDDTSRIYGAGIADNKSGQLIAIKGIEYFLNQVEKPLINISFISSPNEELGSNGFHDFFKEKGMEADLVLGFEPALDDGALIHSRNGNKWFELEFHGHSYHSGRAPKGHMNIAHDFCRFINRADEQLKDIDNVVMNIGEIVGGHSVNTICSELKVKIDTRFSSFDGVDLIDKIFKESLNDSFQVCSKNHEKGSVSVKVVDFCPPMSANKKSLDALDLYKRSLSDLSGGEVTSVHCGGAADINHLSRKDAACFDGLGAVGDNMHRKDEYILTDSLEIKSRAFGEYLVQLNKKLGKKDE